MTYYVITDGHGTYIRKDSFSRKYVPVRNEVCAEKFDQRSKAANILKNALGKNIRNGYKIEERFVVGHIDETESKCLPVTCDKNKVVKELANEPIPDDQIEKWTSGVENIVEFITDAEKRKEVLTSQLSEVDKEITDIHHYIEFGRFNAYQGWLAFNMLRQRLKKRRRIKDELRIIVEIGECKITSDMMIDINNAINRLSNKRYVPRVLTQLFE